MQLASMPEGLSRQYAGGARNCRKKTWQLTGECVFLESKPPGQTFLDLVACSQAANISQKVTVFGAQMIEPQTEVNV